MLCQQAAGCRGSPSAPPKCRMCSVPNPLRDIREPPRAVLETWAGLHLRGEAGSHGGDPLEGLRPGGARGWGWAAAPLRLVPRIPGQGCQAEGSRRREPGGRNANTGGGEKKGGCVCCGPTNLAAGCTRPPAFPPQPQQQGTWGSLGMAVAPSPAWSPSVSLCLTDTGAGRAARGTGMRGWEQGSPVPSPAESSAPCSQPRCHQLGCLGDRRDASVRLGRELGFRRKGCAAWLGGCSLLLEPKSWF